MKALLVLAIPTTILLFLLFGLLKLAGFFRNPSDGDIPLIFMVLILAFVSGFFAAIILVLQIAALFLLRLVPWPGPELKVEEPKHLAGIFE